MTFEHEDHPDYRFEVYAEWIGQGPCETFSDDQGNPVELPDVEKALRTQSHALIYSDGHIAVTMHECCYAMWHVRDGRLGGGSLWNHGEWRLKPESLEAIRRTTLSGGNGT